MTYLEPFDIPVPPTASRSEYGETLESYERTSGRSLSTAVKVFYEAVWAGEIPEVIPTEISEHTDDFLCSIMVSSPLQSRGYFARATKIFARELAKANLGIVLDPLAGSGFMVKALREVGIPAIATDDYSWKFGGPAERLDAVSALRKYGKIIDTLLISWAPYESSIDMELWRVVQEEFPHLKVLLIGEGTGGCTGSDEFNEIADQWPFVQSYETTAGLHDYARLFVP